MHIVKIVVIRLVIALLLAIGVTQKLSGMFSVEKELNKMKHGERICLQNFFKELLLHDSLGHVLFFDTKPGCMMGFSEASHQHYMERKISEGWKCWKKYEPHFPHPNTIIIEEQSPYFPQEKILFIINKKNLLNCLKENTDLFRKGLGESFSPENFLAQLEQEKVLFSLILHDECLLGLILGFGYESALAYQQWSVNRTAEFLASVEPYKVVQPSRPKKSRIFPVSFIGNPRSLEVQQLLRQYEGELQQLWAIYKKSNDILQTILERLCA